MATTPRLADFVSSPETWVCDPDFVLFSAFSFATLRAMHLPPVSRRRFLAASGTLALGSLLPAQEPTGYTGPIIDVHQHTNYSGRTNQQLIAHQQRMGITMTILLPAGRPVSRPSTHDGRSNGLAAQCGGNDTVFELARDHEDSLRFFANEVPDLPDARGELEKFLKLGARGIGEQKFNVACDSAALQALADLAMTYQVPILMHFQHETYNTGIERFHTVLEKYPKVNFIGHAQTWWGNIDKRHDQSVMYPKGEVTPGGITDRLLSDYPNMFGDISAGSGLNSMLRDMDHARGFLKRHQDKLLYGSDCNDIFGQGPGCQGSTTLATVRELAPEPAVQEKILYGNAKKLLRL